MNHSKTYPAYRERSGSWFEGLPEHWEVRPLKRVACVLNGATPKSGVPEYWNGDIAWYTPADIPNDKVTCLGTPKRYITVAGVQSCATTVAAARSILLSTRAPVGSVGITDRQACTNQGCRAISPGPDVHEEFLAQTLYAARQELGVLANGTTFQELSADALRSLLIPVAPKGEQAAIVSALREETARMDTLIEKKTRFIELLKEKRQALVTHAVTKGLNSNAPMKDSGIEWLGEVPAHWDICRIGSLYREAVREGSTSLPILSISIHDGISDDELAPEDRARKITQIEDRTKYKRVKPNDLAYNMMRAWQGAFGAVLVNGLVSPAYVVAQPIREIQSLFVEKLLRTPMAVEEMRRFSRGITDFRMRLYWEYFREIKICVPPIDEQLGILSKLDQQCSRIDTLKTATERSIGLLKERRSALITAAVTGKIDLRDAA